MTQTWYLSHRAAKRGTPMPRELALLDSDLADAGVPIPPHGAETDDHIIRALIQVMVKEALRAA
jgi:hypothetical protein